MTPAQFARRRWGRWLAAARQAIERSLLDAFFPPHCVGCDASGSLFCPACEARVQELPAPACLRCGRPLSSRRLCPACRQLASPIAGIAATAVYAPPLRNAIHSFKYEGIHALAAPLATRLIAHWPRLGLSPDIILPVPLHRRRQALRGYNQSALLAHALGRATGIPVNERLLTRVRDTPQQTGLDPRERIENVSGAFACNGDAPGMSFILIDDVCTTGATLEACAAALRAAGAVSVWGFTLARVHWESKGQANSAPDMAVRETL